jgi:hypothetical protein
MTDHRVGPGLFTAPARILHPGHPVLRIAHSLATAIGFLAVGIFPCGGLTYTIFTVLTVKRNKPTLKKNLADLPMSYHERQFCRSTELNRSSSCVATEDFSTQSTRGGCLPNGCGVREMSTQDALIQMKINGGLLRRANGARLIGQQNTQ